MITHVDDANEVLAFIKEANENYPESLSEVMNADDYNTACQMIEYQLDILYEKIRLIQDIDEFVRYYAETKIAEKENKLRENLKIIEDAADLYHDNNSVAIMVPLVSDGSAVRDRDGAVIPDMKTMDSSLSMDTNAIGEAAIASVSNNANVPCYSNNYADIVKGTGGSAVYLTKEHLENGVVDTITVEFAAATSVNFVQINAVNAKVENLRGILPNHAETALNTTNGYFQETELIGVRFDLTSATYEETSYYTDGLAYDSSSSFGFYPDINDHEDSGQTIRQMEKSITNSNNKYLVSALDTLCNSWSKFNQSVRTRNIKIAEG